MSLSAKPYREWTKSEVDALVSDPPAVESSRLDFKVECGILSSDQAEKEKARRDILKDIAAMANGQGGALIIGIRQTGDPNRLPSAAKIVGITDVERLKKTIDELAHTHLDVRPGPLTHHVIPYEADRSILIVEIPCNTFSLSMVTYGDSYQFWVRRGTDNRPMTTSEIDDRFALFGRIRSEEIGRASCRERV
jgi:predicted HTH transcriptional regulator